MKSAIIKTLASAAFAFSSISSVYANSPDHGAAPITIEDEPRSPTSNSMNLNTPQSDSRSMIGQAANSFPVTTEEQRWFSSDQLRYLEEREQRISKEPKTPSRYLPLSNSVRG